MVMRAEQMKLRATDDPELLADLDFIIATGRRSVRDQGAEHQISGQQVEDLLVDRRCGDLAAFHRGGEHAVDDQLALHDELLLQRLAEPRIV